MDDFCEEFPLSEPNKLLLGKILGRCYREYGLFHAQAYWMLRFVENSSSNGSTAFARENQDVLKIAAQENLIVSQSGAVDFHDIANQLAKIQIISVSKGANLAAIVLVHNAWERFLWRLIRFAIVANRTKVIEWLKDKKLTMYQVATHVNDVDILVDEKIQEWWKNLERSDSLLDMWKKLTGLLGYPATDSDIDVLTEADVKEFEEVRNDLVHHTGEKAEKIQLDTFLPRIQKFHFLWMIQLAKRLEITIPAEEMFGGFKKDE